MDLTDETNRRNLSDSLREQKYECVMDESGLLDIKFNENLPKETKTTIRIFYDLIEPRAGAFFVDSQDPDQLPRTKHDQQLIILDFYTHNQFTSPHLWFPTHNQICSFSLTITSHTDAMCIASGHLSKQVENETGTLKTTYFETRTPIKAESVCIAVGPFKVRK